MSTLNERDLSQGRALYRPQNKQKQSSAFDMHHYRHKPFRQFLSEHCQLPEHLQDIVIYALAFVTNEFDCEPDCECECECESSDSNNKLFLPTSDQNGKESSAPSPTDTQTIVTAEDGMKALHLHRMSLSRYGDTAFLTPLYGVSELVQGFCR